MWWAGYKPVLMVDQVIIYVEGHWGYKIDFSLGKNIVCHLLKQALMLKPNKLRSAALLTTYKQSLRPNPS